MGSRLESNIVSRGDGVTTTKDYCSSPRTIRSDGGLATRGVANIHREIIQKNRPARLTLRAARPISRVSAAMARRAGPRDQELTRPFFEAAPSRHPEVRIDGQLSMVLNRLAATCRDDGAETEIPKWKGKLMARDRVSEKQFLNTSGEVLDNREALVAAMENNSIGGVQLGFFDGPADEEGKPTIGNSVSLMFSEVPGFAKLKGVSLVVFGHGILQKVGDEYSAKSADMEPIEKAQAMVDRLKAGEWFKESEGGSSRGDTILREAIVKVLADAGRNVDPETEDGKANFAKIDEILGDKEKAKSWKARPDVKAYIEEIKIERAKARAAKAREAAGQQDRTAGMDDFS